MLRLLGAIDPTEAEPLLSIVVGPALAKMTQALGGSRSPWSDVIRALPELLGDAALATVAAGTPAAALQTVEASRA